MPLKNEFPTSPYEIIKPDLRWRPTDDNDFKLLPPLVPKVRKKVYEWRNKNYEGASETSKALLKHWFCRKTTDFQYYFAQREAVESVIYLYEVAEAHTPEELRKFENYHISLDQFTEDWTRYVLKLATGAGKTKVLSLVIAWAYFHRLYEKDSQLSKNFLLITPNIIVLDRLKSDFEGCDIFFKDPILPENGYYEQNWFDDFQMDVHLQDDARVNKAKGNLFLTNIHRIYYGEDKMPTVDDENTMDYFLGSKAKDAKKDSADLGKIVRDIDDLMVLNDEAHHIRDNEWAKAIRDLHNNLVQKDKKLSLQIDVTATPKFDKGQIFVQTICDYPLVEAIYQKIVKHPLLPDGPSQAKCTEVESIDFVERYKNFIDVGVAEWQEQNQQFSKIGKKPLLFVMVDDTKNCDKVAEYLEKNYKELTGSVLSIHTKANGDISESSTGKNKEELERLRKDANNLDDPASPYKAVVSVLVLKEGWDVKNVTTIVGLRAYGSDDDVLAEQTLGRGLRRMDRENNDGEYVSVIGTSNFIDFIESIKNQGVEFDKKKMGGVDDKYDPILIEIDRENIKKDIVKLDIELPVLTPKIYRGHDKLEELDVSSIINKEEIQSIKQLSEKELKEITFEYAYPKDEEKREHHKLIFRASDNIDITNLIRWFVREVKIDLRLGAVEHILYSKLKLFIENYLFGKKADLQDKNTVGNLSLLETKNLIFKNFKKAINEKTVLVKNTSEIKQWMKVSKTKPFNTKHQSYRKLEKSVFNKIVGDSQLELDVADLFESADDVVSFAKNYLAVHFHLEYQNIEGDISHYIPDFFVKIDNKNVYIVETKGEENLNDPLKFKRLVDWCKDVNNIQTRYKYSPLYIKEDDFRKYQKDIKTFEDLIKIGKTS